MKARVLSGMACLLLLALASFARAIPKPSPPIKAQVADRETKKPLVGVRVVFVNDSGPMRGESTTDSTGTYDFFAWGSGTGTATYSVKGYETRRLRYPYDFRTKDCEFAGPIYMVRSSRR